MAAENLPLGESSGATTTPSRGQFTLRSLFFFSLRISPLFLALLFLREGTSFQSPNATMFFNALACAAIYGGIFAARAEIRRLGRSDKPPGRSVMPAARKGGLYGALFLSLAIGPAILAQLLSREAVFEQLAFLQKFWSPANVFSFLSSLGGRLLEFAWVAGFLAFFGFFLGAAGGAVVGSVIEARKRRSFQGLQAKASKGYVEAPQIYYKKTSIDA
ncbi:MAG TPA: hypothetical protein VMV10_25225 [Pirellulales bacterium]|nr:hypothetical protein [Pirellulales bacterium]